MKAQIKSHTHTHLMIVSLGHYEQTTKQSCTGIHTLKLYTYTVLQAIIA